MKALEYKNVSFGYRDDSLAVKCVNLSVEEGEFVAVLGQNGSGKSTLARLSNGLLWADEGSVYVFDRLLTQKNEREIRRDVGIVFQNPDSQAVASIVEDDIAFGPENVGIPREEMRERIDRALKAVDMEKYRGAMLSRLSGGQKQRVAVAGILALRPRIMIFDESTAMLDPRGRREIMDVILKSREEFGVTVLMITHFMEEALLADRAVIMHEGKIAAEGKPREILKDADELQKYRLALPKTVEISRKLRAGGLNVGDAFTAEELTGEILRAYRS